MSDKPALPDHLSVNPKSKFYAEEYFEHEVGILLNGKERNNVEEYCISEGWVKVSSPVAKDRFGNPMLVKLKGEVEAFYK
ncbi:MAG: DUF3297 family protein [Saccharospirillaceae bacterium]|jgi:hypothetical protein|nr:DUF3297 family protein [Saccharospirillaceae bacterium]